MGATSVRCETLVQGACSIHERRQSSKDLPEEEKKKSKEAHAKEAEEDATVRRKLEWRRGRAPFQREPFTFADGRVYTGEWVSRNGTLHRHGWGELEWPDGSRYEGQWETGVAHGDGKLQRVDGCVYIGQFRDGKLHGQATSLPPAGSTYQGQWEQDLHHGHGIEMWPDGKTYVGQHRAGVKAGRGRFSWPDGRVYVGAFEADWIQGMGTHEWPDGRCYVGSWKRNMMHGQGIFTWYDGRAYDGQFENDFMNGTGSFRWPDGSKYVGQWRMGVMHGRGRHTNKDGETQTGNWKDGQHLGWVEGGLEDILSEPPEQPLADGSPPGEVGGVAAEGADGALRGMEPEEEAVARLRETSREAQRLEQRLREVEAEKGLANPEVAEALYQLAVVKAQLRGTDVLRQQELLERALRILEGENGPTHASLVDVLMALAAVHGRLDEACGMDDNYLSLMGLSNQEEIERVRGADAWIYDSMRLK